MKTRNIILLFSTTAIILCAAFVQKAGHGVDFKAMDLKVQPGDDFYRYANGNWLRNNPVPASESRWGSFNLVGERNNEILRMILDEAAADRNAPEGSAKQKVGAFYRVFQDTLKRNEQGIRPAQPLLAKIIGMTSKEQLTEVVAYFHKKGIRCFFNFSVGQDLKNSTSYISYLSQGGLGLPDKDYYLKSDAKSESIRKAYVQHIEAIHNLFGFPQNAIDANGLMTTETRLAKVCMSRTERRNQEKQYNKFTAEQLELKYPALRLISYFQLVGAQNVNEVIVGQPEFFNELNNLIANATLPELQNYLRWNVMNSTAGFLDTKLEQQNYQFYSATLTGTREQKAFWKRGIAAANNVVGELLGQLFVAKVFTPASKQRVNAMVDDIVAAFEVRLKNLQWMSAATREKALQKLASFNRKFGYPDKWRDYTGLEIKEDSYLENHLRSNEFGFSEMVANLGKPIDRNRWGMLPQTVNAYYSATLNEIVFPAAIMQPPFFDPEADDAVNYGSIGAVIGHELTHGFDDQGSKYTADGNLKSWWTDEDRKLFEERTKVLVNQFNGYFVSDSLHINGELTLGENIADLGGLTIAFEAFKRRLQTHPGKTVNGFTPEQRFFLGFAQIWKNNIRPEALRQLILTDPHSPGEYRVQGTLSNMPQFYEAFGVKPGHKLFRSEETRAAIW